MPTAMKLGRIDSHAMSKPASGNEMVERANDTRYGLNASVWAGSARAGRAVAARLQAGTVNVNEAYAAAWGSADAPMGGFKESGMGRRHGAQGILKYTESQTIAEERLLGIDTPPLLNHGQYAAVMSAALRVLRHLPGID